MFFSIIIPVYNTPSLILEECLSSIKNCKLPDRHEIIIINDGSSDPDTINFLKNYSETHTKIINTQNRGVSAARNLGMKQSSGKFILCLDSDDKLTPQINNALKKLDESPEYDFLYCDQKFFGDVSYYHKKGEFSKFQQLYLAHVLIPSGTIFRNQIAKKYRFNEELNYSEDKDFFSRAAVNGSKFLYLQKPFFEYRRVYGNNSLSQKNIGKKDTVEKFIKKQFDPHTEITLQEVNKYVLINFRTHPKHFVKLMLIIFCPTIFRFLLKKKIYKNDFIID